MRLLLPLITSLLFFASCATGGGGGGQHVCFPVQPVFGEVVVPAQAGLADYVEQQRDESHLRWPLDSVLPSKTELPALSLRDRQLYSYREFYPDVEDLISPPGKLELALTSFSGAEHEHDAGADLVAQWFHLAPDSYEFDPSSGRTTYFFRAPNGISMSGARLLWISNWVLAQLPTCFLYGGSWRSHEQGGGGAI